MKITMQPTEERYQAPINGVMVPVRIWRGSTTGGVACEVYVLSITPDDDADAEAFSRECRAAGMVPSRDVMTIDTSKP